jgi:predicted phosphoribosyltransferase
MIPRETSVFMPIINWISILHEDGENDQDLLRVANNIMNTSLETNDINFKNKTIIVVDDGAATGSTIIAATRSVRKNMDPKRLIIAIPILPKGTINILKNEDIHHIEVITSPQNRNFISLQLYYQHFDQITDKQVIDMIQRNLL